MENYGDIFITLSRASRRLWNIQRRLLFNIPILIQSGAIDHTKSKKWIDELKSLSAGIFTDGMVFSMGPTISVMGPQGAGKSAFVNSLLNLNQESRLPANTDEGERLPILILHRDKARLFQEREDAQALYINLDMRSREKPERLTYEQAKDIALSRQDFAGWLLWFVENDLLNRYNIFLSPGIKTQRLWLNEILKSVIDVSALNIIVLDSRKIHSIDYGKILENYYDSSRPFHVVLTFSDHMGEREDFLEKFVADYGLERAFLFPNPDHLENLKKSIMEKPLENHINISTIYNNIIRAQVLRGEIEKALNKLNEDDLRNILAGPIIKKFRDTKEKIVREFRGILRMAFSDKVFMKMLNTLNNILNNHIRKEKYSPVIKFMGISLVIVGLILMILAFLGFPYSLLSVIIGIVSVLSGVGLILKKGKRALDTRNLSAELMEGFQSIIRNDLMNKLYMLLEDHVDKQMGSVLGNLNKEILRLEWPVFVLYIHLLRTPDRWIDIDTSPPEGEYVVAELIKKINRVKRGDTELESILDYDKFEHISPVEKAIEKNLPVFFEMLQMELSSIVEMFVFEDIKPSIAREKLNALLFDSMEKFQEAVSRTLDEELATLQDRFVHQYSNIIGLKEGFASPVLLQEALSKARIELDKAIDRITSII